MADLDTETMAQLDLGLPAVSPGDLPDDGSESAAAAAPSVETRLAELEKQLQERDAQIAVLMDAPAAPAYDPAAIAQHTTAALIAANEANRERWRQEQATVAAMTPPQLTPEQKAELIANPDLIESFVRASADHAARSVEARLSQRIQSGEIMHALGQRLVQNAADNTYNQALQQAVAAGVVASADEFHSLADSAYAIISEASRQQPNPDLAFTNMTLSAEAVNTAIAMARQRQGGGVPVERTAPPPSLGTGEHRGEARRGDAPVQRPAGLSRLMPGIKITDDELKRAMDRARRYDENRLT